jgi:hypothetical protein
MIELRKKKNKKRNWKLIISKSNCDNIELDLDLLQFSLTNRFDVVQSLFKDINKHLPHISDWLSDVINSYIASGYNAELILKESDNMIKYANEYIDHKNIDFDKFVDVKKSSKNSILFDDKDIRAIGLAATCLKLSSIFFYDKTLKVPDNIQKALYSKFIDDAIKLNTTDKIFQLIRARTYKSSITDRFMWNLIKMTTLETPETNVMNVFNFLMTNLISLLDIEVNPVHYLIRVADDSVRWLFCEIYKEKIIYGDFFGGSEDIYGAAVNKESFYIHCCNDVLSKAAKAGLNVLETSYGIKDDDFLDLKDRLDNISFIDPSMKLFNLTVLSKVLEIPYKYLLTASPRHLVLASVLMYHLAEDMLVEKYPVLSEYLMYHPEKTGFVIFKSSYKLRDVDLVLQNQTPIFGLNSRKLKYDIISPICGILSASKKNISCIVDGKTMPKITYLDLERDVTDYYTKLYSNNLNSIFDKIRVRLDQYLE